MRKILIFGVLIGLGWANDKYDDDEVGEPPKTPKLRPQESPGDIVLEHLSLDEGSPTKNSSEKSNEQ